MTKKEKQILLDDIELKLRCYCKVTNDNEKVFDKLVISTAGQLAYKLGITDEELNNMLETIKTVDPFIIGDTTNLNNCKFYRGQLQ
jgi:hypothetical protein